MTGKRTASPKDEAEAGVACPSFVEPQDDASFQRLLEQWVGDHLGSDKNEGLGLLRKEGGFETFLDALHRRAPRTMAALAAASSRHGAHEVDLARVAEALVLPRRARDHALEKLDLVPPMRSLDAALEQLDPPMHARDRARIEAWLDLARAIEVRCMVPPPGPLPLTTDVVRDLARVRAHLSVTTPAAAPHAAVVTACARMGHPLPLVVLGALLALGRTPELPAELLEEIDAFFEAMDEPSWRQRAGFRLIPFWAEGDHPRRYACASADGTAFTAFDLKTKALDPDTVSFADLLRRMWPRADWDGAVSDVELESARPRLLTAAAPARVRHPKFGAGAIVEELDDKARVRFDDGSERTMLRRFLLPD
jgi:hypothetical protein